MTQCNILDRSVFARAPASKIGSRGIHINDDLNGPKALYWYRLGFPLLKNVFVSIAPPKMARDIFQTIL